MYLSEKELDAFRTVEQAIARIMTQARDLYAKQSIMFSMHVSQTAYAPYDTNVSYVFGGGYGSRDDTKGSSIEAVLVEAFRRRGYAIDTPETRPVTLIAPPTTKIGNVIDGDAVTELFDNIPAEEGVNNNDNPGEVPH